MTLKQCRAVCEDMLGKGCVRKCEWKGCKFLRFTADAAEKLGLSQVIVYITPHLGYFEYRLLSSKEEDDRDFYWGFQTLEELERLILSYLFPPRLAHD